MSAPKIAIVHDWLTVAGGAEVVVVELHKLFPKAPIYTSVYNPEALPGLKNLDIRTTYLQDRLPKTLRYRHTLWPTLRAKAFRTLDLSEFDIVISSSSAEAKAVRKTRQGQVHIAYIHTPIRYYWSHYQEFRREFKFGAFTPFIRPIIPMMVKKMRKLDLESIKNIDVLIANSAVTQQRITQYYKRPSTIIHPPVDVDKFTPLPKNERSGYILWGRHVPYKRFDLAVEAANQLQVPLTIVGSGPDTERLKKLAGPTVTFVGRVSDKELVHLAQTAKGFLFPNEEDFGISAVEALAAGTPVIAYAKGGALDIVQDGETGVLFKEQTVESLVAAMRRFETLSFLPATLHRKAKRFDKSLFDTRMLKIVKDAIL
ncbi:MAG: glycosyltransferase family 4 protein [Candidatus Microsaccharimonas sossegonensis]|uniref:Glycosyltransferase family 4 protein n=1 Tax=Candidatus Microsaccharimonas sossegonensis TaxID=2506948 RepID=A0A4Q0AGR6_9BACT|nr:MAG: glycosyltransferase family 4 protein [Candidatus Microsaccharimonas sossegonensis]